MDNPNSNKYISLKAAAGLYGYTRDHLGLMIRMSKLKGIKLGSYYVTTNEWMTDYIKNFADPDHFAFKGKLSNKFVAEILSSKKEVSFNVSAENTARKPARTISPDKQTKIVENNSLNEMILKDLTQYKSLTGDKILKKNTDSIDNSTSMPMIGMPYVILPIRKMNDSERDDILKKAESA